MEQSSIFKKLRLDPADSILVLNAPADYGYLIKDIPFDRQQDPLKNESYDFIMLFAVTRDELENLIQSVAGAGRYDCVFWAC